MSGFLLPHEIDYYANPADMARAYPQLLDRARATADRAALLIHQVTQLRAENQRLYELTQPLHKCARCGGNDQCPALDRQLSLLDGGAA